MISRRATITGLAASLSLGPQCIAQQKKLRLGSASILPRTTSFIVAFIKRLAELGYREGDNFTFDFVQVRSIAEMPAAYRAMGERGANMFLAGGNEFSLRAARSALPNAPVVIVAIDYDPMALGQVASLAKPGGLVTGLFLQQLDLTEKRIDLFRSAFPAVKSMTALWDNISADQWAATKKALNGTGIRLVGVEMREIPYDYEAALSRETPAPGDALIVPASPLFLADRERIAALAVRHRMLSVFAFREYVAAGGLLSYGPDFAPLYGRAADYVDRIARGATPAELPMEQPTRFNLVINLGTAKKIGLEVPASLLARADEVIE
ncbi:MAG: ABC transporter substrate-binding protein [Beijerinckiaceae bacterium]|nr:ABC transporter substrate-binding protein [Beijerinckiaceae bacterium]